MKVVRLKKNEIKKFLDEKTDQYNTPAFIKDDPISIPHCFSRQEDIEIAAFLTATISWGQRLTILRNATRLMQFMENEPHNFICSAGKSDKKMLSGFVHRTFNGEDTLYFVDALKQIYKVYGNLENIFNEKLTESGNSMQHAIAAVRKEFFNAGFPGRTGKHFSDPIANSAAKRINMMLRWLVRNDARGVDFGIWKSIQPLQLFCPLDVHSGRVARKLGLLKRTQNDWKAVEELTMRLRELDADDPVKYDFALFGLGVYENF